MVEVVGYEELMKVSSVPSHSVVSAPFQTLNAMAKSERWRGVSAAQIARREIAPLGVGGGARRLFYGALTRSARTGCACVLYFAYRALYDDFAAR